MGMWASCQPLGNILGGLLISVVVSLGYEYTFLFNSILIVIVGIITYVTIKPRPIEESTSRASIDDEDAVSEEEHEPISFLHALTLPNVLPVSYIYN